MQEVAKRRRVPRLLGAVVAAGALLAAGCGSSSKSSSSAASSASSAASSAVSSAASAASSAVSSAVSSASSAVANAGLAAAEAEVAKYTDRPTKITLTEPVGKPIPTGKTIYQVTCGAEACDAEAQMIKSATDILGWTLKTLHTDGSPQQIQAACSRWSVRSRTERSIRRRPLGDRPVHHAGGRQWHQDRGALHRRAGHQRHRLHDVDARPGRRPGQGDGGAHFRADFIVRDAEAIRRELGVDRWSMLGQSFGGFTAMTYLSIAPEGLREAFMTGGLAPIGRPSTTSTARPTAASST